MLYILYVEIHNNKIKETDGIHQKKKKQPCRTKENLTRVHQAKLWRPTHYRLWPNEIHPSDPHRKSQIQSGIQKNP